MVTPNIYHPLLVLGCKLTLYNAYISQTPHGNYTEGDNKTPLAREWPGTFRFASVRDLASAATEAASLSIKDIFIIVLRFYGQTSVHYYIGRLYIYNFTFIPKYIL
jgi:hypothetical protein